MMTTTTMMMMTMMMMIMKQDTFMNTASVTLSDDVDIHTRVSRV